MEPTCLKIIFIRVCVCNTCGFHGTKVKVINYLWTQDFASLKHGQIYFSRVAKALILPSLACRFSSRIGWPVQSW